MIHPQVAVIGGGLAGTEAAHQLARRGIQVTLFEMRPMVETGIHETPYMGELVCSNSLGSEEPTSASGLLKKELFELNSFYLNTVLPFRVPAGLSLSVDRHESAKAIEQAVLACRNITVIRKEIKELPGDFDAVIVASGPLTSPELAHSLQAITKRRYLYFYDATSPTIRYDSIDTSKTFHASRYDKGEADFLNIPLDEEQYHAFLSALTQAECVPLHAIDAPIFYSSCLPIEEIARRGPMSLAFGPLKPVGLTDPHTGKTPFAVIQLRQEDLHRNLYQMVGFQTRLLYPEQKRIFSSLPGLENASFERYGRMHRNSYINAPLIIDEQFRCKTQKNLFFCGQISGVEGYLESIASGLVAGLSVYRQLNDLPLEPFPRDSAIGSLAYTVSHSSWQNFCPTNFTFGLIDSDFPKHKNKKERRSLQSERALQSLKQWKEKNNC